MKLKIVQESNKYTFNEVFDIIGSNESKMESILKSLISMNIIKRLNNKSNKLEIQDLVKIDLLKNINYEIQEELYVFKYVGIVIIDQCCLLIYPKYIKNIEEDVANGYKKFRQILEVIKKYKAKEQNYYISENEENVEFNLLPFTIDLLNDYYKNGIYSNNTKIIEYNGFGDVFWEKTINQQNVYFSKGVPVYLDLYTWNNKINQEDLCRRIHKCIISTCCEKLEEILKVLNINPIFISTETLDELGENEYLIYVIKNELSKQFITKKQFILNKMIEYINENNSKKGKVKLSFIGTNQFNLVWQDVCSVVMENCLDKTLSELNLKSYGELNENSKLREVIPKPGWIHKISKNEHKAIRTLIPDLINISGKKISIYDAKYYDIILNNKEVKNQPGIEDIIKQYIYELSYKKLADENGLFIRDNAFLFPSDEKKEQSIGIARFESFSDYVDGLNLNDIEVILKPCEEMYKKYLNK